MSKRELPVSLLLERVRTLASATYRGARVATFSVEFTGSMRKDKRGAWHVAPGPSFMRWLRREPAHHFRIRCEALDDWFPRFTIDGKPVGTFHPPRSVSCHKES
ncbi:hypothetical protein FIV34_02525 [Luteibacter pinisoli]|uniref:Uncharacterized protein n=1 Tax=Luteibacter pinisoli TaxID=2589080 RepID=A0A4Y5Z122_9GAMM|nr:hypothetical protein [Luteibacter pinisoli]QDE38153.1 hypothetical protein FIV34_02525 [Luteibacter pinisoli]